MGGDGVNGGWKGSCVMVGGVVGDELCVIIVIYLRGVTLLIDGTCGDTIVVAIYWIRECGRRTCSFLDRYVGKWEVLKQEMCGLWGGRGSTTGL